MGTEMFQNLDATTMLRERKENRDISIEWKMCSIRIQNASIEKFRQWNSISFTHSVLRLGLLKISTSLSGG